VRDSWDAELVREMRDQCEPHAAYPKRMLFGIGRGLGSRILLSRFSVDRSSDGDDQSTCRYIVIRASSIVRINITSKCTFCFSSARQSPVLRAIEAPKHVFESYHILIAGVVIVPAENSNGICHMGPSGGH